MRLTVLVQMTKGACPDPGWTERRLADLERLKWLLWHGHAGHAVEAAEGFAEDAWCMEEEASSEARQSPRGSAPRRKSSRSISDATPVSSSTTESDTVPASASRPASSRAQLTRSSPNASPSANRCAGRSVAHTSHCKPEPASSTANWKTSSGGDGRRSGRPLKPRQRQRTARLLDHPISPVAPVLGCTRHRIAPVSSSITRRYSAVQSGARKNRLALV